MHYVYMVRCADGTLYTGYTTDVTRRIKEHNHSKKGAKYTRSRRPVHLVYKECFDTKSKAMSREWFIHHVMDKQTKERLVYNYENNFVSTKTKI